MFPIRDARGRTIGFVFRLPHLIPNLPLWENVGLPAIPLGISRAERRRKACGLLDQVGLGHRLDFLPGESSGGTRKRVALAAAYLVAAVLAGFLIPGIDNAAHIGGLLGGAAIGWLPGGWPRVAAAVRRRPQRDDPAEAQHRGCGRHGPARPGRPARGTRGQPLRP